MKFLLIIGDGMADNPVPELGGKTPLQYAVTPTLDALASAGTTGTVMTVPEGIAPNSDTAILSILGYDPRLHYRGRAPLEAAATGIKLIPGDVAYRCNMVTIEDSDKPFEEKLIVSHSAGAIDGEKADALITELFETPGFREAAIQAGMTVYPGSSYRHIVVQKSTDIEGIELTPPHDHLGEVIGPLLPGGCSNAAALEGLMRLGHEILDSHSINILRRGEGKLPANGIWFWAEGTSVILPDFVEKYGKTGDVVSAVPLCLGIGTLIGLGTILVEGATGELDTNYEGKVEAALDTLEMSDFAVIHIEAPDECTHMGDTECKLQAIERIDARVVAPLVRRLSNEGKDYRMLVISDHKTLTSTRTHDGSPVPYVIYDSRVDRKSGLSFNEADAERGSYLPDGTKLMDMLFEEEYD